MSFCHSPVAFLTPRTVRISTERQGKNNLLEKGTGRNDTLIY